LPAVEACMAAADSTSWLFVVNFASMACSSLPVPRAVAGGKWALLELECT
jgi:hypothetical protein